MHGPRLCHSVWLLWPPMATMRSGRRGQSAAMGASIICQSSDAGRWPATRARYCLWTWRCAKAWESCRCISALRANSIRPEVAWSSRCTTNEGKPAWAKRVDKQSCLSGPRPGTDNMPDGLCTKAKCASCHSKLTPSAKAMGPFSAPPVVSVAGGMSCKCTFKGMGDAARPMGQRLG